MPFAGGGARIDHLEQTVFTMRKLYPGPGYQPTLTRPEGPSVMIAG
jgi:hypothetical protein